jgi:ankyrin repeat protein
VKLLLRLGANVKVSNKAELTATELALMNDKVEVAKFIFQYKADANIRDKICSTTLDTAQYEADEDGGKSSLHDAGP